MSSQCIYHSPPWRFQRGPTLVACRKLKTVTTGNARFDPRNCWVIGWECGEKNGEETRGPNMQKFLSSSTNPCVALWTLTILCQGCCWARKLSSMCSSPESSKRSGTFGTAGPYCWTPVPTTVPEISRCSINTSWMNRKSHTFPERWSALAREAWGVHSWFTVNTKKFVFQGSSLASALSKVLDGLSHVWTGSYVLYKICNWLRLLSLFIMNAPSDSI